MNKISPSFTNTTVEAGPLGADLVLRANNFLVKKLAPYKGFRALPLMSNPDRLEAMLLIPESQMKDLIIPPKLINRGITALNDRWHGRNTDELIFRSVQVTPNGDLGDKAELVTFPRKALLTVLSDKKSLKLIESKLNDPRYSAKNVFETYTKVQVLSATLSAASGSSAAPIVNDLTTEREALTKKEQELLLKEKEVLHKEKEVFHKEGQLAERERKLQEQASQLEQERKKLTVLIQEQLSMTTTPVGGKTVSPAVEPDLRPINPQVVSPGLVINPKIINTGRANNNPDDADRQRFLEDGVSVEDAVKHRDLIEY
ncbi:MAG: hypothetical protein ACOYK1_08410 [Vampirovibrionia bacterium]